MGAKKYHTAKITPGIRSASIPAKITSTCSMETTVRLAAVARVRKKDRLKLGAFPTHASDMHRVMGGVRSETTGNHQDPRYHHRRYRLLLECESVEQSTGQVGERIRQRDCDEGLPVQTE